MATLDFRKNMVFWRVEIGDDKTDITKYLNEHVSKIKIKYSILPPRQHKKKSNKPNAPYEAHITINSKNYIENYFIEGVLINIYMGYNRDNPPHVFEGRIWRVPEGQASELLTYTVVAHSEEMTWNLVTKNRVFERCNKAAMIAQIIAENACVSDILIEDTAIMPAKYQPIQRQCTDFEFLEICALKWGCVFWYTKNDNTIHFYDAKRAADRGDTDVRNYGSIPFSNKTFGKPYKLGYRTDVGVVNNVELVSWSHEPPRAATESNSGITGFSELGKKITKGEFEWIDEKGNRCTWRLNDPEMALYKQGKADFSLYRQDITAETIRTNVYNGIRTHFHIVKWDSTDDKTPPPDNNSGFSIKVILNEGDPELYPPRNMSLFCGAGGGRADGARLPNWIFRYAEPSFQCATLKLHEHELTFENGRLKSELVCGIGMFND